MSDLNIFKFFRAKKPIQKKKSYILSVKVFIDDTYEVKKKTRKRTKNKTVEYIHVNYIPTEINRGLAAAYFSEKGFRLCMDEKYCLTFYGGVNMEFKDISFRGVGVSLRIERIYE